MRRDVSLRPPTQAPGGVANGFGLYLSGTGRRLVRTGRAVCAVLCGVSLRSPTQTLGGVGRGFALRSSGTLLRRVGAAWNRVCDGSWRVVDNCLQNLGFHYVHLPLPVLSALPCRPPVFYPIPQLYVIVNKRKKLDNSLLAKKNASVKVAQAGNDRFMLRTILASKITKNGFVTHRCARFFAEFACYAQDFFLFEQGPRNNVVPP